MKIKKTWHLVIAICCLLFGGASYNVNKESGIIGIVLGVLIGIFYFFPKKKENESQSAGQERPNAEQFPEDDDQDSDEDSGAEE